MSRETMADKLIGEIYVATAIRDEDFKPMDPRRTKRLANIFEHTIWNDAETVNRLLGAASCSRAYRKERRILQRAKAAR
ncbi:MAG: hypothetical protein CL949_13775 [Erythrobacter sp.]|mgnify:CR=1 FL=1|nr:hypothetical protein [Erythrobacter sp.]